MEMIYGFHATPLKFPAVFLFIGTGNLQAAAKLYMDDDDDGRTDKSIQNKAFYSQMARPSMTL